VAKIARKWAKIAFFKEKFSPKSCFWTQKLIIRKIIAIFARINI
jgi:hypothetical protein